MILRCRAFTRPVEDGVENVCVWDDAPAELRQAGGRGIHREELDTPGTQVWEIENVVDVSGIDGIEVIDG